MNRSLKIAGLAAGAMLGGAVASSAAVIDFTDDDTVGGTSAYDTRTPSSATGSTMLGGTGITWEIVPGPAGEFLTYAHGPAPGSIGILEGDNDGIGVNYVSGAEIADPEEYITITFSQAIRVTGLYFLNLFQKADGSGGESVDIFLGDTPGADGTGILNLLAKVPYETESGYGDFEGLSLVGKTFTFTPGAGTDAVFLKDFSLAAIEVQAVPLPAGVLLLGSALGGLGFARRLRKS